MVLLQVVVSAWLVFLAISDLQNGEAPNWATLPPLFAVVTWRVSVGDWILGLALLVVLVCSEWFSPALIPLMAAFTAVSMWLAIPQGVAVTIAAWAVLAAFGFLGMLGGADVKAMMALTALFPERELTWLFILVWIAANTFYLVYHHGIRTPLVVWSVLMGEEESTRNPALPKVAAAGLIYVWLYL